MNASPLSSEDAAIEQAAAQWTLRLDRGLTAEEQDTYTQWLTDPRHRAALALCRWGWDEFDRLAGLPATSHTRMDPDLLAPEKFQPRQARLRRLIFGALPLAASIALIAVFSWKTENRNETPFTSKPAVELIARIKKLSLEDGSSIELNRGAVVKTAYTATERRVHLIHGEAQFNVAKDPQRPFIVTVAGVDVSAIGTRFNIRLDQNALNVIVTEGVVSLDALPAAESPTPAEHKPLLSVGHQATMQLGDEPRLNVTTLSTAEMEQALGWQPRLLDFDNAPLNQIVAEFNQRNQVRLVLADRSLESMRLSSSFWSDNVEGFVRLMESSFGLTADWRGNTEIVLREAGKTQD